MDYDFGHVLPELTAHCPITSDRKTRVLCRRDEHLDL